MSNIFENKGALATTILLAASNSLNQAAANYVCDGVDDQIEVQAAVDALPANGGRVLLSEGDYYFNGGVMVVDKDNVTIEGMGQATRIFVTDIGAGSYQNIALSADAAIGATHIVFGVAPPAIFYVNRMVALRDNMHGDYNELYVTITAVGADSIDIDTPLPWALTVAQNARCVSIFPVFWFGSDIGDAVAARRICYNNHLKNLYAFGNQTAYSNGALWGPMSTLAMLFNCQDSSVENCVLEESPVYGVTVLGRETVPPASGIDCSVLGNIMIDSYRGGVQLGHANNKIRVSGNVVKQIDAPLLATGYGIYICDSTRVDISSNRFENLSYGIYDTGNRIDIRCVNNAFETCTYGYFTPPGTDMENGIIASNTIRGSTYGIYIQRRLSHCSVIGNILYGDAAGGSIGIYIVGYENAEGVSYYDKTVLSGNQIENFVTPMSLPAWGLHHGHVYNNHCELFMDVLGISATHVRSNEDLSVALPITFTIDAQPDVPRTLSGHFDAHANITAYTIVITGVDAKGNTRSQTITEASGWDWETNFAFATIVSIQMTARTGTGAGDTMDIGITDVLGLSNKIYATGDVYKIKKNNANAVVAVGQVDTTYDTYDMAVIGLVAGDDFTIWYRRSLNMIL